MTSLNHCIKFQLNITDPNLLFSNYYEKLCHHKQTKVYVAELVQPACPVCHSSTLKHNGHYVAKVRYLTSNASQPVLLELHKQRVICCSCGKRSMAQTDLVGKSCRISNASKLKVLTALTTDRSMTSIAQENNVSTNTVQRVLDSLDTPFRAQATTLPEHLAFDEVRGVGHKLHFICLDGDNHRIITILSDRFKKSIVKYFEQFPITIRKKVKTVSLDLNAYYQAIAGQLFPKAAVVIDRFHLVQMLNRSFNQLRVQVMKNFNPGTYPYRLLKYCWKLYLKPYSKLEKKQPYYNQHLKDYLTQEHIVLDGLDLNPALKHSYQVLQNFTAALRKQNAHAMKKIINTTQTVGEKMWGTLTTFKHNQTSVLNAGKYQCSNGCLEGINRKIKQIERTAYGYGNFDHLIARIKLEEKDAVYKEKSLSCAA
ncbi:transposase [Lactobacillus acetotolerans]|uniref:Transposase n=1 Tax=Lactobacillus acetotolerans TaxID=1600 RepID=A0A0D6A4X8_9LACO|nr:ISL3 family transposase [Lactobacillus acetotolerans]BAQ57769.1 transposase [Lactobacillus acetotolerans]